MLEYVLTLFVGVVVGVVIGWYVRSRSIEREFDLYLAEIESINDSTSYQLGTDG